MEWCFRALWSGVLGPYGVVFNALWSGVLGAVM